MAQELVIMDDFMGAKNRLKAYSDDNGYEKPVYETVSKRIDDFRKVYKVRVTIEGLVDITGEGYSRRLAEYRAAINAMNEIKEVREEQKKSKEEELLAKEQRNGLDDSVSDDGDQVPSTCIDVTQLTDEDNVKQVNGHPNSEDNTSDNEDQHDNSITINADISADQQQEDNQKLTNGHNSDGQSQGSSSAESTNDSNGSKKDSSPEIGQNSSANKMNGERNEGILMGTPYVRTFQPLLKNAVQRLQDFCLERQSPYPFYDTTYRDRTFLIKCRVEFTRQEEKREFFGIGTGNTSKEAKLMAAEDIVQQLTVLSLM